MITTVARAAMAARGFDVLIGGSYTTHIDTEEDQRRNLALFMNWTPPAGFAFLHHWARADGKGGVFVAEAASALAVLEATTPWSTRMDFDISPLVDMNDAVPVFLRVQAWTDSVT